MMNRYIRKRRLSGAFKALLIFFLIIVIVFLAVDSRMRPIIKMSAESFAVSFSTKKINNSMSTILGNYDISYSDIITLHYNGDDSEVVSLTTNMAKVNRLKSEVTELIQDEINKYDTQIIKIPLGNILGSTYFMGYGPKIKVKLSISSSIESELLSSFTSAGINQTNHRIILRLSTNVAALIPWFNTYTEVSTDFIIAESVIVGSVPESYTSILAAETSLEEILLNKATEK